MECIVICVAGGTGSGKSTFTNKVKAEFGDRVSIIYHDNYYKNRNNIPYDERTHINYDHPDALDTDLLVTHIEKLKSGEIIRCPVYDYSKHTRADTTIEIEPRKIIIIEGILVLHDRRLRALADIKIYVEADSDERILRRIVRDIRERGRDLEGIIEQYLETVKPMHYLYVEPTKAMADIIINSGENMIAFDMITTKIRHFLEKGDSYETKNQ